MKLTFFLLMLFTMQISASVSMHGQVTLKVQNESIRDVFREIENQSPYKFFYNEAFADLNKRVNINVDDKDINSTMDELLLMSDMAYKVLDNNLVVIAPRKELQHIVTGRVTDAVTGEPLPGATVVVQGTTIGTTSDIDGKYSLEVPGSDAVLVFSFVGYLSREILVGDNNEINVVLEPDVIGIEEVVAVGYGTARRSNVVSSMSSVRGEDIIESPMRNVDQMLQGQATGVMVRNAEGRPGAEAIIRIRGTNSIMGGNEALIVVDGLQNASLLNLDYQNVESVEVLKGANATAIYGSQGANGVILITTKSGAAEQLPQVNYTSSVSTSTLAKNIDLMDPVTFAEYRNAIRVAQNREGTPDPIFNQQEIEELRRTGGTNWQDELFQTGISHNHSLSIDGGTETVNYWFSGSFLDQQGVLLNSGYERYLFNAKLDANITDWLSASINSSYTLRQSDSPNTTTSSTSSNPIRGVLRYPPTVPVYDEDGLYAHATGFLADAEGNPMAEVLEPIRNQEFNNSYINATFDLQLTEGLTFSVNGGAILDSRNDFIFWNNETKAGASYNGLGERRDIDRNYYQNTNILNYEASFEKHEFGATGVFEQKYEEYMRNDIEAQDFPVEGPGMYASAAAAQSEISSSHWERYMLSYVGRLNYGYDNKYLLNLTYRADGSSVFGAEGKWGYFPSVGIGWRLSNERFIADLDFFDNLMIRSSWGITGNQAISPYQTLPRITTGSLYPYNAGTSNVREFYINNAGNPSLKWEETEQIDFGIDVSILRGRLRLTADYYNKKTSNLLMSRAIPRHLGLSSIIDNVGEVNNTGYEFTVYHAITRGNFRMNNNFNISFNETTVINLGDTDRLGFEASASGRGINDEIIWLFEGESWGNIYGWNHLGTWNTDELEEALSYGQLPGDQKYEDLNGDGVIDIDDRMFIGNVMPDFIYGFNSQMTYRNFELSFKIEGSYGHDILSTTLIASNWRPLADDRWTEDNQNTSVPGIIDQVTRDEMTAEHPSRISFPSHMQNANSRWVFDGSYIRLRNLQIGYRLPDNLLNSINFKNARVYLSGENLITLTDYPGYNPEVSSYRDDKSLGNDSYAYPVARIFQLGFNVTF